MFDVRLQMPLDQFPDGDAMLRINNTVAEAAGRRSDWSGFGCGVRDYGWTVNTFDEATGMIHALKEFGAVRFEEHTTL